MLLDSVGLKRALFVRIHHLFSVFGALRYLTYREQHILFALTVSSITLALVVTTYGTCQCFRGGAGLRLRLLPQLHLDFILGV